MIVSKSRFLCAGLLFLGMAWAEDYPSAAANPGSALMLRGPGIPVDSHTVDFSGLMRVRSKHVVVSDARPWNGVNQHNYLVHHLGKYWVMWSDGPGIEDRVGQRVKFATSEDGLTWSDPRFLTPVPPNSGEDSPHYNTRSAEGYRYISRGFWLRDGELLAFAALDEAAGFFGPSLALHAFAYDELEDAWRHRGVAYENAINNFPPKKLPTGEWLMTRRSYDRNVFFLRGGVTAFNEWESYPVVSYRDGALLPEEPYWWMLPDGNLCALFRDNKKSGYVYRAFSTDLGKTWSPPVKTNFPDASSKFNGLRLEDGRYVLVSNANPEARDPLVLSVSDDGLVFHTMGYLVGGRRVDYPHVIEHDGHLLIAFSGAKSTVEVMKIRLEDVDALVDATKGR